MANRPPPSGKKPSKPRVPGGSSAPLSKEEIERLFEEAQNKFRADAASRIVPDSHEAPPPPARDLSQLSDIEYNEFMGVLYELAARRKEALKILRPTPIQEKFFGSHSPERLIIGGNRSGKQQPIDEPVLTPNGFVPIGSLKVGDIVTGGDGNPCVVTGVFPQGRMPVWTVTFDDGASTRCGDEHLWKVQLRKDREQARRGIESWQVLSLAEIRKQWNISDRGAAPATPTCIPWMPSRSTPIDPYVLGLILGDGSTRSRHIRITSADPEILDAIRNAIEPDYRLHHVSRYDYSIRKAKKQGGYNPLYAACRYLGIWDKPAHEKRVPNDYLFNDASTRLAILQGLMDTDGSISTAKKLNGGQKVPAQSIEFGTSSPGLAQDVAYLVRSLGGKCRITSRETWFTTRSGERRQGRPSWRLRISLPGICPFRLARKRDQWRDKTCYTSNRIVRLIEPAGEAECVCISVSCPDGTYVTKDCIVTHNTTAACIEIARMLTGQDPYNKYPKTGGRLIIVGPSLKHLGSVYYEKLFKPGAFWVIRDEHTGEWRPFYPNFPGDAARANEARKAPPLIPARFLSKGSISWKLKGDDQPLAVRITKTGWEAHFFSFNSAPPMGWDVDAVVFDEECATGNWYNEMSARLLDRRRVDPKTGIVQSGKFIWSFTPQNATPTAFDLWRRADELQESWDPESKAIKSIDAFVLTMDDNPHLHETAKAEFYEKHKDDPEQLEIRMKGRFAIYGSLVYGDFAPKGPHGCQSFAIPDNWTRYCAIDPGTQVCAVLFAAIPPPHTEHENRVVIYDELYIKRCNAEIFAEKFVERVGQTRIQYGLIDHHAGRITEIGSGRTIEEQYSSALKKRGFKFQVGGANFMWGSDDKAGGIESVKNALHIIDGRAKLLVFHDKCPNLLWEMERYSRRKLPDGTITDDTVDKNNHCADCLRYLCANTLHWVRPPNKKKEEGWTHKAIREKKERERNRKKSESGFDGSYNVG